MTLRQVYAALYRAYGPQHWWPGDTPFEVMVGAVLTQNTAWSNVEKAIDNLKAHDALDPAVITHTHAATLAAWLKPSGYFNIKARRLKNFCAWYLAAGGLAPLQKLETPALRRALLGVNGIGPETADDILLYAFQRPVFVIDAYTRRLFSRLQLVTGEETYEELRHYFEQGLGAKRENVALFNEYHALIVAHAKRVCRTRPLCDTCCLRRRCSYPTG
ncbi:MAG: endonuclease III domain-containing protein [Thiohalomonadaceae bacterium]